MPHCKQTAKKMQGFGLQGLIGLPQVKTFVNDLFNLLFPKTCRNCMSSLHANEYILCLICVNGLPKTRFKEFSDNELARIFAGRVNIRYATALFYFSYGGSVRKLVHAFKYQGDISVGNYLGSLMASHLKENPDFSIINCLIAVPMHPKKKRKRGYNQSQILARVVSEKLNIPILAQVLSKRDDIRSQTTKKRFDRWEDTREAFFAERPELLKNKHLLIIDDIVTTGATLEACARLALEAGAASVSVAVLAFTP